VTVFDFSVGGNAKTLGHAFVSLHFRHFEALSSRYKFAVGSENATRRPTTLSRRSRRNAFFRRRPERRREPNASFFHVSRQKERFRFRAVRDNVILYVSTRQTQGGVPSSKTIFPEKLPLSTIFPVIPTLYRPV
jgi:hypothetical protein